MVKTHVRVLAVVMLIILIVVGFQNCTGGINALEQASLGASKDSVPHMTGSSRAFIQQEAISVNSNNVYSPSLIIQGGTLVMYFGGWYEAGQTHDNIYRSECPTIGNCQPAALLLDAAALGFEHLNDPSVIQLSNGTYLMYLTGVYAGVGALNAENNHTFISSSSDAIHWSKPQEIISELWLPSAAVGPNGHVYVYGNCSTCGEGMVRYDLGDSGHQKVAREVVSMPRFYSNVEVRYRPNIAHYQIVGETNIGGVDQIDLLTSTDGLNWSLAVDGVIHLHAGQVHLGTPAAHPDSENILYYRETTDHGNTQNKLWGMQWDLPSVDGNIAFLYRDVLNREPDMDGGLAWSGVRASGVSLANIRCQFAGSTESQGNIANLYVSIFSRQPASSELQDRINDLCNGASFANIQTGLANIAAAAQAAAAAQQTVARQTAAQQATAQQAARAAAQAAAEAKARGIYESTKAFVINFGNLLDAHRNGATGEQLFPFIAICNASKAIAQNWGATGLDVYICQ